MSKEKSIKLTELQLSKLTEALDNQAQAQSQLQSAANRVAELRDLILDANGVKDIKDVRLEGNELKYS